MSDWQGPIEALPTSGVVGFMWKHRLWWVLPMCVLFLLVGIIYALGLMSAADPETYPTTLQKAVLYFRAC
jgi:hypothetical protein